MNRKVVSRLGIFFIGVPLIIMLILLNQMNHLAIHIVVTAVSVVAACEFYHILDHNFKLQNKLFVIILAGIINLAMLLRAVFEFDVSYVDFVFVKFIRTASAAECSWSDCSGCPSSLQDLRTASSICPAAAHICLQEKISAWICSLTGRI